MGKESTDKDKPAPTKKEPEPQQVFIIDEKAADLLAEGEDEDSKEGRSTFKSGVLTEQEKYTKTLRDKDNDKETINLTLYDSASNTSSMTGPIPLLLEEKESKETFSSKLEYILTLVSYAIGFGSMWRFPYLMQEYGGVVFLVPYTFMLAFLGIPIFLLELAIGQRVRKSSIKCWNQASRHLAGIGVACALSCVFIGFYENTLIAWCFSYLINSVQNPIPWKDCKVAEEECNKKNGDTHACESCEMAGSSSYFWHHSILGISESITDPGSMNWAMFGSLIFSWILIWAILVKGMAVAGKIAYITSLLPYLVMIIFLIRGLMEEGMKYGFEVVFTPDWKVLYDIKVWFVAGTQILFTQGLAVGILVSYAALQAPNNNCVKDAIMVPLIDFFTSILACVVNCPILGAKGLATFQVCVNKMIKSPNMTSGIVDGVNVTWLTNYTDTKVFKTTYFPGNGSYAPDPEVLCDLYDMVKLSAKGTGLIFITFTTAVQKFPAPQVWAVLFFIMLLTVGIGSSFPQIEGFILCIQDIDFMRIGKVPKWKITSVVCLVLMVCSIVFAWGWGQYVLTFIDEFTANWSLLVISFAECVGIAWVYGIKRFSYDLHLMTGKPPSNYFIQFIMVCLKFIAPFIMIILIMVCIVQYGVDPDKLTYLVWNKARGQTKMVMWPTHVTVLGFMLTFFIVGCIPLFAILAAFKIYPLREEKKAKFPERRLRRDRDVQPREYDPEPDPNATRWEKILFWKLGDLRKKPPALVELEAPMVSNSSPAVPAQESQETDKKK